MRKKRLVKKIFFISAFLFLAQLWVLNSCNHLMNELDGVAEKVALYSKDAGSTGSDSDSPDSSSPAPESLFILYVSSSGNDSNDGYSLENAKASVNSALSVINAASDSTADWTVYISGKILNTSLSIGGISAKSLTLIGKTDNENDGLMGRLSSSPVIKVESTSTVPIIIKNLFITNGTGGIYYEGGGNLTVTDCDIRGNITGVNGGGIYFNSSSNLLLTGETNVGLNKANKGGGIYLAKGTLDFSGTISNNTATNGGGIYVGSSGEVQITGGVIGGDTAENGNTADVGAGVYITEGGKLTLSGGKISNNSASGMGSGIFVYKDGTSGQSGNLSMGGTVLVEDNNDVYLVNGSLITLSSAFDSAVTQAARITPGAYTSGTQVLSGPADLILSEREKFSVTPNGAEGWIINSGGYLVTLNSLSFTFTLPVYSNDDIKFTATESGTDIILSAASGYSSYMWIVGDSLSQVTTENTYTLPKSSLTQNQTYTIIAIATDSDGNANSANAVLFVGGN